MYTNLEKEEWIDKRRGGIGGTDAAAILGLSPWRTPVTVWLEKMGKAPKVEETEAMRIGIELEDYVARSYTRETGLEVRNYNKFLTDGGCLIGNVDRLVIPQGEKIAAHKGEIRTNRILECKTSSREWEDCVPLYYQAQVQHYMGLAPSVEVADVACLFLFKKHFEIYHVERDNELIAEMQERLREWWDKHIVHGEIPKATNEEDCKAMYERSNQGKTITASDELREAVDKYKNAQEQINALKDEAQAQRDIITSAMEDAEAIVGNDGKPIVTWKSAKGAKKIDWERLARDLWLSNHMNGIPLDMIDRYATVGVGARRFIVK